MLGCLYCTAKIGPFTSVEHVIPETMGNTVVVLPKGAVCDPCNNGVLSRRDATLINYSPIAFARALRGLPTKKGKTPVAALDGITIVGTGPMMARMTAMREGVITERPPLADGRPHFQLECSGTEVMTPDFITELARSLHKIALGLIHWRFGPAVSMTSAFDPMRQFVRWGRPAPHGVVMVCRQAQPEARGWFDLEFLDNLYHSPVSLHLNVYGVQLYTEVGHPTISRPEMAYHPGWNILPY